MSIRVSKVGHIVLRVQDLDRELAFYCDVLGLREVARHDFGEGPMAFLSTGNAHHDVALVNAGIAGHRGPQLHHFALKVGDSLDELAAVKAELESKGIPVHMTLDHHVSQGVYVTDPEGNLIELYVDDAAERWRDDPSAVAHSDPLSL